MTFIRIKWGLTVLKDEYSSVVVSSFDGLELDVKSTTVDSLDGFNFSMNLIKLFSVVNFNRTVSSEGSFDRLKTEPISISSSFKLSHSTL